MTECPRHRLLKQVGGGFVLTALMIRADDPLREKPAKPDGAIIRLYAENGDIWQSAPVSGEIPGRQDSAAPDKGFGWFVAPEEGTEGMTISFLNETSSPVTIQRATIELQTSTELERDEIELPLWPATLHQDIGLTFVWQKPLFKATGSPAESEQGSDSETDIMEQGDTGFTAD